MAHRPSRRILSALALSCLTMALPASASAAITLPDALSHVIPGQAPAPTAAPPAAAAPCSNTDLVPTSANGEQVRSATLCLLNVERTSRGLHALRADRQLRKVADSYSQQMVTHSFFAHVGFDGSTLRSRVASGTRYLSSRVARWSLGENLYWGSGALATPAQSVSAWMHSPGHRVNVLNPKFRDIGIGIAIGAPDGAADDAAATYTTEYGTRAFH